MLINFLDEACHVIYIKCFWREMYSEVKPMQIHHTHKLRPRLFDNGRVNGRRKADEHADTAFGKARLNAFNRCAIKICRNALIYVLAEKAEETDFFQNYTPKLRQCLTNCLTSYLFQSAAR